MKLNKTKELTIRKIKLDEVDFFIAMAEKEGWNPGKCDGEAFYRTDPQGFFIAELSGEPVGCISAVAYDETFGFLGFYIVKPEFRRYGYGLRLFNTAMDYLGKRTIGGDGVVPMLPKYETLGFHIAYRNIRYESIGEGSSFPNNAIPLSEVPFSQLVQYDRTCFPVNREGFLREWIKMPNAFSYAIMEGDQLTGYGVIRSCQVGYKIGPLFANNAQIAETLFQTLSFKAKGVPIFLDVPEVNPAALALVSRHKMKKVFETARIYNKEQPKISLQNIYGITSFELG